MHRTVLLVLLFVAACREGGEPKDSGEGESAVDTESALVDGDSDGYAADVDCDDGNASIHPGATELCDFLDNDCDGVTDEDAVDAATWFVDADGDGWGGEGISIEACEQPSGFVDNRMDCNDLESTVNPDAEEACDGRDNDCDGSTDEDDAADASTWTEDADGDGYGGEGATTISCNQPPGYVIYTGDCDDADARYNPSAIESDCADPNDYNCDGSVGFADLDADGFAACEECDDTDAAVNENAVEVCDGIDNDCDGDVDDDADDASVFYGDADGDGHGGAQFTATACAAPTGYVSTSDDCDDLDSTSYPGAQESCDLADNDCDGDIDEGVGTTWYEDADSDGYGNGSVSTTACSAPTGFVGNSLDCDDYSAATNPGSYEICDAADNDCDGQIDEDAINAPDWYLDGDGDGYGSASGTLAACEAPSGYVSTSSDCDDTTATVSPGTDELCDSVDNDCDGAVDEASAVDSLIWYLDSDGDGYGVAGTTVSACSQPGGYASNTLDCDDSDSSSTTIIADADCDGTVTTADCDDTSATSNTIAVDADCDGVLTADDCDDTSATSTTVATDGDCDGVLTADDCDDTSATSTTVATDGDCDGVLTADDCDDSNASSTSVAADADCDGILTADDCDDTSATSTSVATDGDCDGVLTADDCDDSNASSTSLAADADCDGVLTADDCDDTNGASTTVAIDADCDGVLTTTDCNDASSSVLYCSSCYEILQSHPSSSDGTYTIDPDGSGGSGTPFQIHCDMTLNGGGWGLVARMTTADNQAHYSTGSVALPSTGVALNSATTQKFSDSVINSIRTNSPYSGSTSYRMTCWEGESYEQTMYCSRSCSFNATVSVQTGDCSRCAGSFEGSLVQFSPNTGTRGLGHHHDHSHAWSMAYQRHPEDGNNAGCRSDAKGSGDGHLWIK